MPSRLWPAAAVHVLTASGAVFGFLALEAGTRGQWETAFAWLGVALFVDGLDGPLARWFDVKGRLPRFSGETLDLVIDYLTYVVVPAYLIYAAGLVPDGFATLTAGLIVLSSLYHFSDRESKTPDGFFVGFPALWNLFALYAFVFAPPPAAVLLGVVLFTALTLVPLKWAHPVRVRALRPVTLAVTVVWTGAAIIAVSAGFPGNGAVKTVFAAAAIYYVALGLSRPLVLRSAGKWPPSLVPTANFRPTFTPRWVEQLHPDMLEGAPAPSAAWRMGKRG